jgi:hypothetical protein
MLVRWPSSCLHQLRKGWAGLLGRGQSELRCCYSSQVSTRDHVAGHSLTAASFVSAARERIRWLEGIIKERLPDVDLRSGPQVDPSSDPTAPSQDKRIPEDVDGSISSIPPVPTVSRKRSAEASGQSDQDESFPERAHSVAVNLGMLSLNIDSPQKHYLGSSSGLLFTNLIGASPPSVESTPQGPPGDRYAGDLEWSDDAVAQNQNKKYHRELYSILKQVIPLPIVRRYTL